jgi:hypothetical protein
MLKAAPAAVLPSPGMWQRPGQVEPLAQALGQGAAGIAGPADAAELTARK